VSLEKKDNIEDIKKNEEKYRQIIYNLSDVIVEIDSNGIYTFVNSKYFDLFGYTPEEVIGQKAFNFMHPEDASKITEAMKKAVESGEVQTISCRSRHKNGYYIPIFARGNIFLDRGKLKIVGIVRKALNEDKLESQVHYLENILEHLEDRLKEKTINFKDSEKKFQHLFQTSPYAILILNFKGKIIECNPATEALLGYNYGDLKDKIFLDLVALPPESLKIMNDTYTELTKGNKVEPIEIQVFRKNGEILWVRASTTLVKLYEEILIQVIAQDITEQKLMKFREEKSF